MPHSLSPPFLSSSPSFLHSFQTSEQELLRKELHGQDTAAIQSASEDVIYKIDIPANRYDMLCLEGIARALNIFRGKIAPPQYKLSQTNGKPLEKMVVKPETSLVRPFIVCAVLRGVSLDPARYASLIDLQDKLHTTICRQRSLVAIGTHDMANINGPFSYEALPPEDIKFVPLKQTKEFNAKELLEYYASNDQKLKKYVPIIQNSMVYPVVLDADRNVLSLPPVINGARSAITLDTKDIFIECTATDLTKAKTVLNTICAMFAEYCRKPFEIEPVEVVDAFGIVTQYPILEKKEFDVKLDYINSCTGLTLPAKKAAQLLVKMQLEATAAVDEEGCQIIRVHAPVTRSDVLHACDVMEDVAIAYGYNNLVKTQPKTVTAGKELALNGLTELLRLECAMSGFTEVLTWALCSRDENFKSLRREDDGKTAVSIGNPATAEFEVCRTSLLPAALKTLAANKDSPLPIKLFECSDVILLDSKSDVGAVNKRRLVAVAADKVSGFEVVHGLLNRVMDMLRVPLAHQVADAGSDAETKKLRGRFGGGGYEWKPSDDPTFFPGRHATIYVNGQPVGQFGVVHPEVLEAYEIPFAVSALELEVEPFVFDIHYSHLT
jgi:phenylalanyl-tRNA synthetase beta chain